MARRYPLATPAPVIHFPAPCPVAWETMTKQGRARLCARCDRQVHELAQYTPEEIIALADPNAASVCGQAEIRRDGSLRTRAGVPGLLRAASVALPILAAPPAAYAASPDGATGISGTVNNFSGPISAPGPLAQEKVATVTVTGEGTTRTTQSGADGRFVITGIVPGTYRLEVRTRSAAAWSVEGVLVCPGSMTVQDTNNPSVRVTVRGVMVVQRPGAPPPPPPGYIRTGGNDTGLRGFVTAPDGTYIVGATVVAEKRDDHRRFATTTDAQASYQFLALPPGAYAVSLSLIHI